MSWHGMRAAGAGVLGTIVAWYGFFLPLARIDVVFGPRLSTPDGRLVALLIVAAGFVGRPLGAAFFGSYGDRFGRTSTLVFSLLAMSASTASIGVLLAIGHGPWIAAGLVVLRVAQGAALGGEWAAAMVMAMEWAPAGRRGLVASLPQVGVPLGLLASMAVAWIVPTQAQPLVEAAPFVGVVLPMGAGLLLRIGLRETPAFTLLNGGDRRQPLRKAVRCGHEVMLKAGARISADVLFYGVVYAVMLPALVAGGARRGDGLEPFLLAACAAGAVVVPLAGAVSDRDVRGRRGHVYGFGIALLALTAAPYFLSVGSFTHSPFLVMATAVMLAVHAIQYGPQAAVIGEAFPADFRVSGSALSYHLGSLPSTLVPVAAILVPAGFVPVVIGFLVAVSCVVSVLALQPTVPLRWSEAGSFVLLAMVVVFAVPEAILTAHVIATEPGRLGAFTAALTHPDSPFWKWVQNVTAVAEQIEFVLAIIYWLSRPRN